MIKKCRISHRDELHERIQCEHNWNVNKESHGLLRIPIEYSRCTLYTYAHKLC